MAFYINYAKGWTTSSWYTVCINSKVIISYKFDFGRWYPFAPRTYEICYINIMISYFELYLDLIYEVLKYVYIHVYVLDIRLHFVPDVGYSNG